LRMVRLVRQPTAKAWRSWQALLAWPWRGFHFGQSKSKCVTDSRPRLSRSRPQSGGIFWDCWHIQTMVRVSKRHLYIYKSSHGRHLFQLEPFLLNCQLENDLFCMQLEPLLQPLILSDCPLVDTPVGGVVLTKITLDATVDWGDT